MRFSPGCACCGGICHCPELDPTSVTSITVELSGLVDIVVNPAGGCGPINANFSTLNGTHTVPRGPGSGPPGDISFLLFSGAGGYQIDLACGPSIQSILGVPMRLDVAWFQPVSVTLRAVQLRALIPAANVTCGPISAGDNTAGWQRFEAATCGLQANTLVDPAYLPEPASDFLVSP